MKLSLTSITTWQTLRVLARGGNVPLTGKVLRVDRSRYTRDGTFLDKLVSMGLLEVVAPAAPAKPRSPGGAVEPAQFRTTYRLTPAGLATADTGEYEKPDTSTLPVYDTPPAAPARAKPASGRVHVRERSSRLALTTSPRRANISHTIRLQGPGR